MLTRRSPCNTVTLCVILAASISLVACIAHDPRPPVVFMPRREDPRTLEPTRLTFTVPDEVRKLLAGKAVVLNVPNEMRAIGIDYLRDAGGVVVEGSRSAAWTLNARSRTERVFLGTMRDKLIVDVELAVRRDDYSWHVVMRGRGEELYYGHEYSQAVALAGQQALERLSK